MGWRHGSNFRIKELRTSLSLYCAKKDRATPADFCGLMVPEKSCCLPKDLPPSLSCVHGTSPCLTHFTSHQLKFNA